ncbi:hypothetical protein [Jeotgalibacillus proteolyticus]|uniref:Uncharacterized protein n=1 Tax=Jeotgalibacillus proteolyticus TaxID=2082395 RepID=A0A2S5GBX1_9BACL|nr:hypothetical protein [Jeotgalibacillus proteolyticus]PPA70537.1 hypothetical protein C4B60_06955 [Jeotgalibacillus proteolyticus]
MFYTIITVATVLATLGITFNYIAHLGTIVKIGKEGEQQGLSIQGAMTRFFFATAIIELVPLAVIIITYITVERPDAGTPVLPLVIIAAAMFFGVSQVLMRMRQPMPEEIKKQVRSFSLLTTQLITSIPIIAVVFMFI